MAHKLFIISGPSAVGKTTIAKRLFTRLPHLHRGISYTTRTKRSRAVEDKVMRYISEEEFRQRVEQRAFIEWSTVYGHFYGTDKRTLYEQLRRGHVLLNLDVQGALRIKRKFPAAITIFIEPQSIDDIRVRLERRLRRHEITLHDYRLRLRAARVELSMARRFDFRVLNQQGRINRALREIETIIREKTG